MEPRGLAISHRDNSKAPTEPVPGSPEIFSNMANKHGDYRHRLLKPARGLAPLSLIVWRGYRSVSVYVQCQFTLGVNSSRYGRSCGWYTHPTSTSVPNANREVRPGGEVSHCGAWLTPVLSVPPDSRDVGSVVDYTACKLQPATRRLYSLGN